MEPDHRPLNFTTEGNLALVRVVSDPVKDEWWIDGCVRQLDSLLDDGTLQQVIVDLGQREWYPLPFVELVEGLIDVLHPRNGEVVLWGASPQMATTLRHRGRFDRVVQASDGLPLPRWLAARGSRPMDDEVPGDRLLPAVPQPDAPTPCPSADRDESSLFDCLVISDLHLGSEVCQARLLEEFIEWACQNSKELVINGDIFNDLNFKRLSKRHFACLRVIRRNSDRSDFRLIWIRGNHDGPVDIISHLVGVPILDEYIYENEQVRLLILHGDQFDSIVSNHAWLTDIASNVFYFFQRIAPHHTSRWVRRTTKLWQRNSQRVERGAVERARSRGCELVTCGHTHLALASAHDGVRYFNTGTWTEQSPCPFLAVRGGVVSLEFWPASGESAIVRSRAAGPVASERQAAG